MLSHKIAQLHLSCHHSSLCPLSCVVHQVAWREHRARVAAVVAGVLVRHSQLVAQRYCARRERAAVVLQATWRGHAARTSLASQVAAATLLQCALRVRAARCQFLTLRGTVLLLQRKARSALRQRRAARRARAATAIQTAWRTHAARNR
jgi:hypothetical protein